MVNQAEYRRLPAEISVTLQTHWRSQFIPPEGEGEAVRAAILRALQAFGRKVWAIIDAGVTEAEILDCIDKLAIEPEYWKFNRGTILKRLQALRPQRFVTAPPEPRDGPSAVLGNGNPAVRALRACPDIEDAPNHLLWFGKRPRDGKYARNIDRPLWRELHSVLHGRSAPTKTQAELLGLLAKGTR